MAVRKPLSKRTRFEVFKRDGFRCVYCGANPNDGPLHVDHVHPVAEGGTDDETNLVTACQSCNGGKAAVPLEQKRFQPIDPALAADHAEQIRAWLVAQGNVLRARRDVEQRWVNFWCDAMGTKSCDPEIPSRFSKIVTEWGLDRAAEAVAIVAAKAGLYSDTDRLRYLYGILRKWRENAMPSAAEWSALHPPPEPDPPDPTDDEVRLFWWENFIHGQVLDHGGVIG